jgi:flagellar hook-basal body complex protein FliE
MSIEAITGVSSLSSMTLPQDALTAQPSQPLTPFSSVLNEVSELSAQMAVNEQAVQQLSLGGTDNLHQVMMNMESARLQFDLLLQVRNKVLEAYQELMRMQI